jgi:hypothetical protein
MTLNDAIDGFQQQSHTRFVRRAAAHRRRHQPADAGPVPPTRYLGTTAAHHAAGRTFRPEFTFACTPATPATHNRTNTWARRCGSGSAPVSPNGGLLSRRGCSLPASVGGFDTHCDAIMDRGDHERRLPDEQPQGTESEESPAGGGGDPCTAWAGAQRPGCQLRLIHGCTFPQVPVAHVSGTARQQHCPSTALPIHGLSTAHP